MTVLGLDVSHFQGSPNFAQVRASGREFVVLKATEGTGYVDPTFTANRRNAHAAGLIVGHYHFARGGSATAEAAWFVRTIGALQPGEFLVLDWEITYAGDHVAWCKAWLDAVTAATGVAPLIYMNQSAMNAHNWMPLSGAHGLWLAKYDGSTSAPTACNCWPSAAMKQYSSTAAVPGVAGSCDVNAFYGTTAQLLAYGKGGTPTPTGGFLMALTDAQQQQLYDAIVGGAGGEGNNISRLYWMVKGGKEGPDISPNNWHWADTQQQNRTQALEDKVDALAAAVKALQSGGVDPAVVIKGVLDGLNGTTLNVSKPT